MYMPRGPCNGTAAVPVANRRLSMVPSARTRLMKPFASPAGAPLKFATKYTSPMES
jgi:hypothetical protein